MGNQNGIDEMVLETCNLLQNPPKTRIDSLQLKLKRPKDQQELKVSLGHDSAGKGHHKFL